MDIKFLKGVLVEDDVNNNPYVFLDIDGVLIPAPFRSAELNIGCVQQINRLVNETGARVILSSSWRQDNSLEAMNKFFKDNGITFEIADYTITLPGDIFEVRGQEIQDYINSHGIKNYLVIDDMRVNIKRLLKCLSVEGLTKELADRGIELLKRGI